jgi:hypothetical protein
MARTSGQTGVVQVCMLQVVESMNAQNFAGEVAELDFHAAAGATFSAASSQMQAFIVTGTGTDESAAKLAFGINAGGGGGSGWAGQATAANPLITIATGQARYTVVAAIPSTATEIGVALCFTPVGTAGANDYITLSGIQLTRNSALRAAAAVNGGLLNTNDARAKGFARRSQAVESILQQRYFYRVTETAAIFPVAPCAAIDTTHTNCIVKLPATMRSAPRSRLRTASPRRPRPRRRRLAPAPRSRPPPRSRARSAASTTSWSTAPRAPCRRLASHRSSIRTAARARFRQAPSSKRSAFRISRVTGGVS